VLLLSLRGRGHVWSIPVAIPMAIFAVYAATAWPIWAALNSGAGSVVTDICGALAIALGVYTAHLLIAVLRREKTVEVEVTAPSVARQLASARR
jgi:hypothetical protein